MLGSFNWIKNTKYEEEYRPFKNNVHFKLEVVLMLAYLET
jgi:hypothetical protein